MKALGRPSVRTGEPILGRRYVNPPLPLETLIMAAVRRTWEGLTAGPSGTYIMPHAGGYTFGRWWKCRVTGGYRFERLGDRFSVQACRDAFEAFDKAADKRARELNRRKRR